jgi:hypothetical protein
MWSFREKEYRITNYQITLQYDQKNMLSHNKMLSDSMLSDKLLSDNYVFIQQRFISQQPSIAIWLHCQIIVSQQCWGSESGAGSGQIQIFCWIRNYIFWADSVAGPDSNTLKMNDILQKELLNIFSTTIFSENSKKYCQFLLYLFKTIAIAIELYIQNLGNCWL